MDATTLQYMQGMDAYTARLMEFGYVPPSLRAKKIFNGIGRFLSGTCKLTGKVLGRVYDGTIATARGVSKVYDYAAPRIQKAWEEGRPAREKAWEEIKPELKQAGRDLAELGSDVYTKSREKARNYTCARTQKREKSTKTKRLIEYIVMNGSLGENTRNRLSDPSIISDEDIRNGRLERIRSS